MSPTTRVLALHSLLLLALFVVASPTSDPNQKVLDQRNQLAGRKNGTLLLATVSVVKADAGDSIEVAWTLDYNGPRPPLVIVKPSRSCGATTVTFFAESASGELCTVDLFTVSAFGNYARENDFLVVDAAARESGVIVVPINELRLAFEKKYSPQIARKPPKTLYVQLKHTPSDRGTKYELDAWTGALATSVTKVPLRKW